MLSWGSMGALAAVAVGLSAAIGGVHTLTAGERLLRRLRMHRADPGQPEVVEVHNIIKR
jgi:hypothetical protein